MSLAAALEMKLGLVNCSYRHNLPKDALFHEALNNDRGRVRVGGGDDEPKAFATRLGVKGPLVFYTDPTCTGRPVDDTYGVAWPEIEDDVWWKSNFKRFDPDSFQALLGAGGGASQPARGPSLRARRLCRDRSCLLGPLPLRGRVRDARDVRPQHVSQDRSGGRGRSGQGVDHAQRAVLPLRIRNATAPAPIARQSSTFAIGCAWWRAGPTTAAWSRK